MIRGEHEQLSIAQLIVWSWQEVPDDMVEQKALCEHQCVYGTCNNNAECVCRPEYFGKYCTNSPHDSYRYLPVPSDVHYRYATAGHV